MRTLHDSSGRFAGTGGYGDPRITNNLVPDLLFRNSGTICMNRQRLHEDAP